MKSGETRGPTPGAGTESSRKGAVRELLARARLAATLVMGLCLLSVGIPSAPASAEERVAPQLVRRGDAKIAAVLSIYPSIFPLSSTSAALVCVTNVNANSTARLEPNDVFVATLDELALETFSMLSPILLVDSETLESSEFVAAVDTVNRRLVITYVGAPDAFEAGDSICAALSLSTSSVLGSRTIRFDIPPFESRFSGGKDPSFLTFAVAVIGPTIPMGPAGPTGAAGADGTNGVDGATGATGTQARTAHRRRRYRRSGYGGRRRIRRCWRRHGRGRRRWNQRNERNRRRDGRHGRSWC